MNDIVSVYLITMNRLEFLKKAVDSALNQEGIKLELVVVDNGSSDGTRSYMECTCRQDSRINYIRLQENKGACYARNLAIEKARGKYITGLDDDDYFCPGRIKSLLETYQNNTNCAFTYADDWLIKNGVKVGTNNKHKKVDANKLRYRNYVGNQVFSEKCKFQGAGGFDEELHALQDYDLWLRMTERYGTGVKARGTLQYIDIGNHQRISSSKQKFSGYMQFYRKHKHAMTHAHRRQQLLITKHQCRDRISLRCYMRLFDMHLIKGKIKIFFSSVI